jgi:hypothetical protein
VLRESYRDAIVRSNFFKQNASQVDEHIATALLRIMKIEIFMPKDMIIIGGTYYSEVFFMLEGKGEMWQLDG